MPGPAQQRLPQRLSWHESPHQPCGHSLLRSLYLYEALVSFKASNLQLTVFVGLTLERLGALEAQCRSWPGPLSAAVYVPVSSEKDASDKRPSSSTAGSTAQMLQLSVESRATLDAALEEVKKLFTRLAVWPSETLCCKTQTPVLKSRMPTQIVTLFLPAQRNPLPACDCRAEAEPGWCGMTLQLLVESVADPPLARLVPINSLRNVALLPTSTPLVRP